MNKTSQPSLCWDANIFIAVANNESDAHPLGLFVEAAERVQAGELRLIVPTIVIAEFHAVHGDRDAVRVFDTWLFETESIEIADLTAGIASLAGDLRSDAGSSLRAFDAVVLATAISRRADALWTRDSKFVRLAKRLGLDKRGCDVVFPESDTPLLG